MKISLPAVVSAFLLGLCQFSFAAVLLEKDGIQITDDDVRADALRIPEPARKRALSNPQNIQIVARNLWISRSLANDAERMGLAKEGDTARALQIARDRILSEARLQKLDQDSKADSSTFLAYAQNVYRTDAKRFETPEERRVRHILVREADGGQAKAEDLLDQLKRGADFMALAKANSSDAGSAEKGGDIGKITRGRTVPEFEAAAFGLSQINEFSKVTKTEFGYHIIQLLEVIPVGKKPFEDVKEQLIKDAMSTLLLESRADLARRVADGVTVHDDAVEAFSRSYRQ